MITKVITSNEWPGPDTAGSLAMVFRHERFLETLLPHISREFFNKQVCDSTDRLGNPSGDYYDLDTLKIWLAAWIETLSRQCEIYSIDPPDWLKCEKNVLASGHFPVGYSDDSCQELLVLPGLLRG